MKIQKKLGIKSCRLENRKFMNPFKKIMIKNEIFTVF
jgi:hypothetical protein